MSETMTRIRVRGTTNTILDYGARSHADMVAQFRAYAEHMKRQAEEILAATDYEVTVVRGPIVQRFVRNPTGMRGTNGL